MKTLSRVLASTLLATGLAFGASLAQAANQSEIDPWVAFLKPKYFPETQLIEGESVITMTTPYRSEDAAYTPVTLTSKLPQSSDRYIEKVYMFVDKNPQPLVGVFNLTPEMGRADLAMRIRIDQYTNVRAIAVLNNGEHHMVTNFVKAAGGCSAPLGSDYKLAMEKIGNMKFRTVGDVNDDQTLVGQFMLSHPNITGMQKDQKTQLFRPAHYVESVKISYNGKHVMTAETGFSISQDPSFRFFFKPQESGELTAEVTDSKGLNWTETFKVEL